MGISNQIPTSRIAQAGVIANTSERPASPYEGQLVFQKDTNQLLIYDGSAWVMAVDTDTPPGLELVKTQTIGSAVSSVPVNDVFSATYDNYRITITGGVVSVNGSVFMQLNGITGSVYSVMGYFMGIGIATLNPYAPAATTRWEISSGNTNGWSFFADVINPQRTERKFLNTSGGISAGGVYHFNGYCDSTASATGFTLTHGTGGATFTGGTVRVYGYRN